MKLFAIALAFLGAGALACPADDPKDAQAPMQDKAAAEAKAPVRAPAQKAVASKKAQTTKVADKAAADAARKSSL
jgi:adenine-specific DNA glycosylase